jgi:hypothetical protein
VLERKQSEDAVPCRAWVPSLPADLAELCDQLLARDPRRRPTGEEVLRRLGRVRPAPELGRGARPDAGRFVGRERELDALRDALAKVRGGSPAAVCVHGPSGMGKSALVRHFLAAIGRDVPDAVVLEGRCYERESVPYKSLDSMLDALSATLARAEQHRVERLLPGDIGSLARLFPVLRRVDAVDAADSVVPVDAQELRHRAFGALRELLERLAAEQLTVLSIDDLQWGDADSAGFLFDLIHHPSPPPVLFLGTYRTAEAGSSALLRTLLRGDNAMGSAGDLRLIELSPLSVEESQQLAGEIMGTGAGDASARAQTIARDTGGNPFFVTELARTRADLGPTVSGGDDGSADLDALLAKRVRRLPAEARALLTAAAVAGRPTPRALLAQVAKVDNELAAVALLQADHLIRVRTAGDDQDLETYHDRIRETITARLPEYERRSYHRRLARAYEAAGARDPQSLVDHWLGAGEAARAGEYAVLAGQQAATAAAFDHAQRYFGLALSLLAPDGERRRELEVWRADALASAGHLLAGARLHLEAANGAEPARAVELKRRAMMHLLRGGRLEEGLALARDVLAAVGLRLPSSRLSALLSVVYRKLVLALRRRRLPGRGREPLTDRARLRMDVCWSVQTGVAIVNPLYGAALQLRYVQDARRFDDHYRAALALGIELGFTGMTGSSQRERVAEISCQALALAERGGTPHGHGVAITLSGFACFLTGQWRRGGELTGRGTQILLDDCVGAQYEVDIGRIYHLASLFYAGQLAELTRRVPLLLREAVELGNEYLANALRSWRTNVTWLLLDDPVTARQQLAAATTPPMEGGVFHLHHFYPWVSECQIELYLGAPETAWKLLQARWRLLQRSMLRRIQSVRIESDYLYARTALALAATGCDQTKLVAEAARHIRKLEREQADWSAQLGCLLRAGVAHLGGDSPGAEALLAEAARGFEAAEMPLFSAVARLHRGRLLGGEHGAALERAALTWMTSASVRAPARIAALLAPALSPAGR